MTKLYEDALKLSIDENLGNLATLLEWAKDERDMAEKIRHTEQAHHLLTEVVRNLHELRDA